MNTIVISTIKPLIRQLNAILGAPSCIFHQNVLFNYSKMFTQSHRFQVACPKISRAEFELRRLVNPPFLADGLWIAISGPISFLVPKIFDELTWVIGEDVIIQLPVWTPAGRANMQGQFQDDDDSPQGSGKMSKHVNQTTNQSSISNDGIFPPEFISNQVLWRVPCGNPPTSPNSWGGLLVPRTWCHQQDPNDYNPGKLICTQQSSAEITKPSSVESSSAAGRFSHFWCRKTVNISMKSHASLQMPRYSLKLELGLGYTS